MKKPALPMTLPVTVALLLLTVPQTIQAQLAITEVMAHASVHLNPDIRYPDFWELTNFGNEDTNLDGYFFSDSRRTSKLSSEPFHNLLIPAGKSVIFFRSQTGNLVTTPDHFRAWWGAHNLPADLEIRVYSDPGLDGEFRDELWIYDAQTNVVDGVMFGESRVGRSFTYAIDTGAFGVMSMPGVSGAFQAAQSEDFGSPGWTEGASGLRVVRHPSSQQIDAGMDITLAVVPAGLPRPKFQWYFGSTPIEGATQDSLTLTNVQFTMAGEYSVLLNNGLDYTMTLPAFLTVNTNPTPPVIVEAPQDVEVFPGQSVTFTAKARGFPAPRYQWDLNGEPLPGATNAALEVNNITGTMSGNRYTVSVSNNQGATNVTAKIKVVRRPLLKFTEVMPAAVRSDSSGHYDWFELTNFDTNRVNLQGYFFFDTPSFVGAHIITEPLFIEPGESIVFVEEMSPERFTEWWGEENLKPGQKIYTYHGFSLRDVGEALYLWNACARDPFEYIATAAWAGCTVGVSLECVSECSMHEEYGCVADCLIDSVASQNGAFRREESEDIASPGYITNPPPHLLEVKVAYGHVNLRCRGIEGTSYRLLSRPSLNPVQWTSLFSQRATNSIFWMRDSSASGAPARFYRLQELP